MNKFLPRYLEYIISLKVKLPCIDLMKCKKYALPVAMLINKKKVLVAKMSVLFAKTVQNLLQTFHCVRLIFLMPNCPKWQSTAFAFVCLLSFNFHFNTTPRAFPGNRKFNHIYQFNSNILYDTCFCRKVATTKNKPSGGHVTIYIVRCFKLN